MQVDKLSEGNSQVYHSRGGAKVTIGTRGTELALWQFLAAFSPKNPHPNRLPKYRARAE